jgi:hypothetical protein
MNEDKELDALIAGGTCVLLIGLALMGLIYLVK